MRAPCRSGASARVAIAGSSRTNLTPIAGSSPKWMTDTQAEQESLTSVWRPGRPIPNNQVARSSSASGSSVNRLPLGQNSVPGAEFVRRPRACF